jgi:hypothetical protein
LVSSLAKILGISLDFFFKTVSGNGKMVLEQDFPRNPRFALK